MLGLLGVRGAFATARAPTWHALLNATAFYELLSSTVVALETNTEVGMTRAEQVRVLPQVHQAFGQHFVLQAGLGVVWHRKIGATIGALRVVVH